MADPVVHDHMTPERPTERMQRLRVGVTGLAAIFLVVLIATEVASGLRRSADANNATSSAVVTAASATAPNSADPDSEPLAQLGVAPGPAPESGEAAPPKK